MKKNQLIPGLVVLVALAALLVWGRGRIHFDFGVFVSQLKLADWRKIGIAFACIYVCYAFRAARWALLLRHIKKVPLFSLLSTQVIGFTAVALIGRIADPVRPYLVSKKTGLPLSNQVAVYIVERLFDAGSMALIFSATILLAAWFGGPDALPHPEVMKKVSYGALATTVAGALFLIAVRLAGGVVASFLEGTFGVVSKGLGRAVGEKIRAFRAGLDTLRSFSDFGIACLALAGHVVADYPGLSGDHHGLRRQPATSRVDAGQVHVVDGFRHGGQRIPTSGAGLVHADWLCGRGDVRLLRSGGRACHRLCRHATGGYIPEHLARGPRLGAL